MSSFIGGNGIVTGSGITGRYVASIGPCASRDGENSSGDTGVGGSANGSSHVDLFHVISPLSVIAHK